ncbi:hypothetical protein [Kitasatospora sp. NPDC005748]|uniref:hypothetical protein n=1 Tax=Kitasatospora sp. NPDC005748 TaxID=3157063 RepID=UPI0033CB3B00
MSDVEKYDYAWLSRQIGVPVSWLQKNKAKLPRIEFGHYVRFSPELAEEIRAKFTVRPNAESAVTSVPATLLDLKPGRAPRGRRTA